MVKLIESELNSLGVLHDKVDFPLFAVLVRPDDFLEYVN